MKYLLKLLKEAIKTLKSTLKALFYPTLLPYELYSSYTQS